MILYMYIAPGQRLITSDDKISKLISSVIFVKFHIDTPDSKGTKGQKTFFCTLGAGADNSNGVNFEHHRKLSLL